jgi:uncharacterized membrane protein
MTAVHIFFYQTYVNHHPAMANMGHNMPSFLSIHPRLTMLIFGPVFGALSGIILGLFALLASKIVKKTN